MWILKTKDQDFVFFLNVREQSVNPVTSQYFGNSIDHRRESDIKLIKRNSIFYIAILYEMQRHTQNTVPHFGRI